MIKKGSSEKLVFTGLCPAPPLKGFLEEALKDPKNFQGIGFDRVSFTP